MPDNQPIWIFLWSQRYSPVPNEQRLLMCAQVYAEAAGMKNIPDFLHLPDPAILREEKGKPYFPAAPDLHFSLSHSGDYAACAYHSKPVGLDIQVHSRCGMVDIARRFFHPGEYGYLEKTGYEEFFPLWAAKESYVKYTGLGIAGELARFCVTDDRGLKDKMGGVEFYRKELPDCSLCLCAAAIPDVKLVDIREDGYTGIDG